MPASRRPSSPASATREDLAAAAQRIGFPAILKTVRGGYDGKGQWRVDSLDSAAAQRSTRPNGAELIFEAKVPLACELSVIATRNARDEIVVLSRCREHARPGNPLDDGCAGSRRGAIAVAGSGDGGAVGRGLRIVGTYCVEFFLSTDGRVDAQRDRAAPA